MHRPSRAPNVAVQQFVAPRRKSRSTEGISRDGNPYQQRFPLLAGTFSGPAATDPERVYVWRAEQRKRAQIARELATYTDRELFDLRVQRADFPAIINGTYTR
jgi:uncharacterized protein YjiS (DUF1127 family)